MITNKFPMRGAGRGISVLAFLAFATSANAEWTVDRLDPSGSAGSQAFGGGGDQKVGNALLGSTRKAVLWVGPDAVLNLNPLVDGSSNATDTDGNFQVGNVSHATYGGKSHAALWQGSAASYVDLNPTGSTESFASGVDLGVQVGRARFGGVVHAGMWAGSASTWVDLHPTGAFSSSASGVADGQQVGRVTTNEGERASLWTGTAQSWVDLNPAGARSSSAHAVSRGRQVGAAEIGGIHHAGFWTGSSESWVSLNQPGWSAAAALGAFENLTVGGRAVDGQAHAGIWTGTADSWVDLHAYLPSLFISSQATAVWKHNGKTYVVGHGNNNDNGEALLWISDTVPEPSGVLILGAGLAVVPLLRRARRRSAAGRG